MVMPIMEPHPRGYANPVILRITAALPGFGAWDATPIESFSVLAQEMTMHFTYTRGADGGAFDFQLEISIYSINGLVPAGAAEWVTMGLYAPGPVAPGVDSDSRVQREYITYTSQGAVAEDFYFPVELNKAVERVRVRARESGVTGTPGTLQITAILV